MLVIWKLRLRPRRLIWYGRRPVMLTVPTDVPAFAGVGFLLQRRAVADAVLAGRWRERPSVNARVPVALFADRAVAGAHRDRMATECRAVLNPFVFVRATSRPTSRNRPLENLRMLALWTSVTCLRPWRRASSKA